MKNLFKDIFGQKWTCIGQKWAKNGQNRFFSELSLGKNGNRP